MHLNQILEKAGNTTLSKSLDQNHGCLDREIENEFQQRLFSIMKVEDYQDYLTQIGMKVEGEEESHEKIIQAIKNSRQKGYHGNNDCKTKNSLKEDSIARVCKLVSEFSDMDIVREEIKQEKEDES